MPILSRGFAVGFFALLGTACGGGGDDAAAKKCTEPVVQGTPFDGSGTATVHGSGTLPSGLPDGYQLELLVNEGFASVGVLPPNVFDSPTVCGRSFKYTIQKLDAGTYRLDYDLFSPNSTSTDPDYTGTSTNEFTVADGQDVAFDPVF
jgi:hypothetical protein